MVFARVWGTGISNGQPADGAKLTQLDINVSRALDGAAGGKNSPTARLIVSGVGGFQVSDVNEAAPFVTADAKWLGAELDFGVTKDTVSAGGQSDAASSYLIEGAHVCVDTSGNDNLYVSFDDGNSWKKRATAATFVLHAVGTAPAGGSGGNALTAGTSANVYYSFDDYASWIIANMPGTPTLIKVVHYDPVSNRWILLGKTAGAPYICTATVADPPVGTQRTVPASITGSLDAISLAQNPVSGRMVASWTTQTKVAYSDDGINWAASTTSLASGSYIVRWGDGVFVAYDMTASGSVYVSTDGSTWTTSGVARARTGGSSGVGARGNFASMNGAFFVVDSSTNDPLFLFASTDKCATWKRTSLRAFISAADYTSASLIKGLNRRLMVFASSGAASIVYRSRKLGLRDGSG